MEKVVIRRPGGFERLALESAPDPAPGAGQVRISVRSIGVNFADCLIRMGLYKSARELVGYPITPGFEFAGLVSGLGAGVHGLALGSEVLGVTRFGAYTSELCVPRSQIFPVPPSMSLPQAGAFPVAHLTAWYALHNQAQITPGRRILVHSAAGGVGSALLQLAKRAGCFVVGVVGAPHKRARALELGADAVIDKSSEDLWASAKRLAPPGYHAVFDANGPTTLRQSYAHLAPGGRLIVYGFHSMMPRIAGTPRWLSLIADYLKLPRFNPLHMTDSNRGVLAFNLSYLFGEQEQLDLAMRELLAAYSQGQLKVPLPKTFALADVAAAHRALQSAATVGKLVLIPAPKAAA